MKQSRSQIVTLGGGGFSMEPDNPLLDDFILGLTRRARPRICFVPTASGDSDNYVARFYYAFRGGRAATSHLKLVNRDQPDLRKFLLNQDVIFVGGGNTANLLAIWRLHGVDRILREAWRRGVVLAGISAGMNCWFEGCSTDSFGPLAALPDGVGFLPGSACPHYDGEARRRPTYHSFIQKGLLPGGLAADVGAALHFVGRRLKECVSSRPDARGYSVRLRRGKILETALPTRYLGKR